MLDPNDRPQQATADFNHPQDVPQVKGSDLVGAHRYGPREPRGEVDDDCGQVDQRVQLSIVIPDVKRYARRLPMSSWLSIVIYVCVGIFICICRCTSTDACTRIHTSIAITAFIASVHRHRTITITITIAIIITITLIAIIAHPARHETPILCNVPRKAKNRFRRNSDDPCPGPRAAVAVPHSRSRNHEQRGDVLRAVDQRRDERPAQRATRRRQRRRPDVVVLAAAAALTATGAGGAGGKRIARKRGGALNKAHGERGGEEERLKDIARQWKLITVRVACLLHQIRRELDDVEASPVGEVDEDGGEGGEDVRNERRAKRHRKPRPAAKARYALKHGPYD